MYTDHGCLLSFYSTIEKRQDKCSCKLNCLECGICIHHYSCTCIDATIHHCKHLHLFIMSLKADDIILAKNRKIETESEIEESDAVSETELEDDMSSSEEQFTDNKEVDDMRSLKMMHHSFIRLNTSLVCLKLTLLVILLLKNVK